MLASGQTFRIPAPVPEVKSTYIDFDAATITQQKELLARMFLVESDLAWPTWKVSGEERTYLGYRILKATTQVDSVDVEAWFTPELPVPAGPLLYGGLPGIALIVSIDSGKEVYTATSVELATTVEIEKPSEGQTISPEEFDQVVAEKADEVRAAWKRLGLF